MSQRLGEANRLAGELHRGQVRKGTAIPYISHLYAVAALVLEWGGDEDAAIAALLHDAVEDCAGPPSPRSSESGSEIVWRTPSWPAPTAWTKTRTQRRAG